jgi:hypothetical protein
VIIKRLAFVIALSLIPLVALAADESEMPVPNPVLLYPHLLVLALGLIFVGILGARSFGRRIQFEDLPTFPKYMTSRSQYIFGLWSFILLSMTTFWCLVYFNRQVFPVVKPVLNIYFPGLYDRLESLIVIGSPPYFVVVVVMSIAFLALLRWENEYNPLSMLRDLIQSWIKIPYLAKRIAYLTKNALSVPNEAVDAISDADIVPKVYQSDFTKNLQTIDRKWAELSYIKWWLERRNPAEDATFFTEDSFNWRSLREEYNQCATAVGAARSEESNPNQEARFLLTKTAQDRLQDLLPKFTRLIACYLVYKNDSRDRLAACAKEFGIDVSRSTADSPLWYSIIYLVTLLGAVYIGVYSSAIVYDLFHGLGFEAFNQDPRLVERWLAYTAANYGGPIVLMLVTRFIASEIKYDSTQSYLARYCAIFLLAWIVGPFLLTIAIKLVGTAGARAQHFSDLYGKNFLWGIGPGLMCVYLCYYLDKQTQPDLPDVVQRRDTVFVRLSYSLIFTCVVMVILSPLLMQITANPESMWDSYKLRAVATGATLIVTLSLALVAQFCLRKGTSFWLLDKTHSYKL